MVLLVMGSAAMMGDEMFENSGTTLSQLEQVVYEVVIWHLERRVLEDATSQSRRRHSAYLIYYTQSDLSSERGLGIELPQTTSSLQGRAVERPAVDQQPWRKITGWPFRRSGSTQITRYESVPHAQAL